MTTCKQCGYRTQHDSWCTGGCKLKPYVTEVSYSGRDWSGDLEYVGPVGATYADGTPVHEADGTRTDAKFSAGFEDRIGAKKDKKISEMKRAFGCAPLHFTKRADTSKPTKKVKRK